MGKKENIRASSSKAGWPIHVFTAVLVAFKRAALPGYFQSNRRVLWVKRKKKSDHTSIQQPSCVFFFFLFSLWLVCSSRAHFSHDVGHTMAPTCICIHTAERSPTKEEESQPARTKRFSFFFSFLLEGVYIYLYIYIHINITEEPPALASWCPGPPFCLVPLYHRLWWFPLTTDDDKEKRACLCKNGADLSSFYVLFCTHFFITRGCCFFFFFYAPILCVAWRCQVECSCRSLAQRWQQ